MPYKAAVVTPWAQQDGYWWPQLALEYTLIDQTRLTDSDNANITPAPNEYTVQITCEDAVMAAIEADPDYEVLWSEEITDAS